MVSFRASWVVVILVVLSGCNLRLDIPKSKQVTTPSGSRLLIPNLRANKVEILVWRTWLSESADCSNPVQEFNANGIIIDLVNDFIKFSEDEVPAGKAFHCFIMEVSDDVAWKPVAPLGACHHETIYRTDICPAGYIEECTSGTDKVKIYFSTDHASVADVKTNPFKPPVWAGDSLNGLLLAGPLSQIGGAGPTLSFDRGEIITGTEQGCSLVYFPDAFTFGVAP